MEFYSNNSILNNSKLPQNFITKFEKFWLYFEIFLIFISIFVIVWSLIKLITKRIMSRNLQILCINQCSADMILLLLRYIIILHLLQYPTLNYFNQILSIFYNGFHDFFAINTICILSDCMFSTIFAEKYKRYIFVKNALFLCPWLSSIFLTAVMICCPTFNQNYHPALNSINLLLFTAAHLLQYCNHRCYYCLTNLTLSHQCILRTNVKNMKIISFLCITDSFYTFIYFCIYYFLIDEKFYEKNTVFITIIYGILQNLRIFRCLILPFGIKYFYFHQHQLQHRRQSSSNNLKSNEAEFKKVYYINYDKDLIFFN